METRFASWAESLSSSAARFTFEDNAHYESFLMGRRMNNCNETPAPVVPSTSFKPQAVGGDVGKERHGLCRRAVVQLQWQVCLSPDGLATFRHTPSRVRSRGWSSSVCGRHLGRMPVHEKAHLRSSASALSRPTLCSRPRVCLCCHLWRASCAQLAQVLEQHFMCHRACWSPSC